jgi:RNA recognition motif-containing protein
LQLYVGNLPYETSWQHLKDFFKQCGKVDKADVVEGADGRKKGFGIVRFFHADDAKNAIRRFDGVDYKGRQLEVHLEKRGNNSDGGPRDSIGSSNNNNDDAAVDSNVQLFVGNLSFDTSWQDLKEHFKQYGRVDNANVVEGADSRKKGIGIVRFVHAEDAQLAMERSDGVEFQGRKLEVRLDQQWREQHRRDE